MANDFKDIILSDKRKKEIVKSVIEKNEEYVTWDSDSVMDLIEKIEHGYLIKRGMANPFFNKDPKRKKENILFAYTKEEIEEIEKCAQDPLYFAEKYCYSLTDKGIQNIKMRSYQKNTLDIFKNNRLVVFLAGRQIGKCVSPFTIVKTPRGTFYMYELWYNFKHKKTFIEWLKFKIYNAIVKNSAGF